MKSALSRRGSPSGADFPACRVEAVSADLATEEGRQHVSSNQQSLPLQILVNNSGTNIRKRMSELSLEEYRQVQEVNLVSCFEMCRLLYPMLLQGAPVLRSQ